MTETMALALFDLRCRCMPTRRYSDQGLRSQIDRREAAWRYGHAAKYREDESLPTKQNC